MTRKPTATTDRRKRESKNTRTTSGLEVRHQRLADRIRLQEAESVTLKAAIVGLELKVEDLVKLYDLLIGIRPIANSQGSAEQGIASHE